MSDELEPCPFCGGEASMESGCYQLDDGVYAFAHVECLSCGACGSGFTESETAVEEVEHLAAEAWNRRAERTCVFRYDEKMAEYACSACGERVSGSNPDDEYEVSPMAVLESFEYCPRCGAKVVER